MAKLVAKQVEELLLQYHGNLAAVGRACGASRSGVLRFVERHPSLKAVLHEARESMKDHAESALHAAVIARESWAVCFYLKCQAKDRGYIERTELQGGDRPVAVLDWDSLIRSRPAATNGVVVDEIERRIAGVEQQDSTNTHNGDVQ